MKQIIRLTGVSGPAAGTKFESKDSISIGRNPENHIALDDQQLSGQHARIAWAEKGLALYDLKSSNGTWVGDTEIESIYVNSGDHFEAGESRFKIEILPAATAVKNFTKAIPYIILAVIMIILIAATIILLKKVKSAPRNVQSELPEFSKSCIL